MALAAPALADLPTTGAWIFPHERQQKILAGELGEFFYNTTSSDPWIADAFFADSDAGGATLDVDFYNPTQGELSNVILWIAINDDELFTSIDLSGGASGEVTVVPDDLSGGTPTTNAPLPDFVYPAHFTSYGIGKLTAGEDGIITATLEVTGDFDGGLVLRFDYTATDGAGNDVSGPFSAGMSVYEWGDLPADEDCPEEGGLELDGSLSSEYKNGKLSLAGSLTLVPDFQITATNVVATVTPGPGLEVTAAPGGEIKDGVATFSLQGTVNTTVEIPDLAFSVDPLLLDGDASWVEFFASWNDCHGADSDKELEPVEIELVASGEVQPASYWGLEVKRAQQDEGGDDPKADHTTEQLDGFMQTIALHSDIFTYSPWGGTDPFGGKDGGWVDLGDLADAEDTLYRVGSDHGAPKEALQELLALWLNAASGGTNRDSETSDWARIATFGAAHDENEPPTTVGAALGIAESALGAFFEAGMDEVSPRAWWAHGATIGEALRDGVAYCRLINTGTVTLS